MQSETILAQIIQAKFFLMRSVKKKKKKKNNYNPK